MSVSNFFRPRAGNFGPPLGPQFQDQEVQGEFGFEEAVRGAYHKSWPVAVGVQLIAKLAGELPLRVERWDGDSWEPVYDHPLSKVCIDPHPDMCYEAWLYKYLTTLLVGGQSFHYAPGGGQVARYLYPLIPDDVNPVMGPASVDHYKFGPSGTILKREEVIHTYWPDLLTPGTGDPPLRPLMTEVRADQSWGWWWLNSARQGGRGGAVVDPTIKRKDQLDEKLKWINEQLDDKLASGNFYAPWLFGGEAKYESFGGPTGGLEFMDGRKFYALAAGMVFGILGPMMSGDAASYGNLRQALQALWRIGVKLAASLAAGSLTKKLLWAPDPSTIGVLRIMFNFGKISELSKDRESPAKVYQTLVTAGYDPELAARYAELPVQGAGPPPTKPSEEQRAPTD